MNSKERIMVAIAEAIRGLGQVPSGVLYAHVMSRMEIGTYEQIISALKRAGLVSESAHMLKWAGGSRRMAGNGGRV